MNKVLLEIKDLRKEFVKSKSLFGKPVTVLHAVDGVSLSILEGETLGLVGESGCGKSTLGRMITRLCEPTGGQILLDGVDITHLKEREVHQYRQDVQMIFQDPYASLNPRMTIQQAISAPLDAFRAGTKQERKDKTAGIIKQVGLTEEYLSKYPHELSGGQRQRIAIARAMILKPRMIVCDEPVSALDVSVRAQVLNLMKELQKENKVSFLFISHDLSVTHHLCDRIAVMYLGKLMEVSNKDDLYRRPLHPYTQSLLSSIPLPDRRHMRTKADMLEGDVPSPISPPSGCRFHTRCKFATEQCRIEVPVMKEAVENHFVACHKVQG